MNAAAASSSHLIFRRGRSLFALGACAVSEILSLPELGPAPAQRSFMVGLAYLRGRAVPVMDLDIRLGRAPQLPYRVTDFLVILEHDGATTGLIVSEVIDIILLDPADFHQTDEMGGCAVGVGSLHGEMVTLLDVARLLSHPTNGAAPGRNGHANGHLNGFDADSMRTALPLSTDATDPDPIAQAVFRQRGSALAQQSAREDVGAGHTLTLAIVGLNDERIGLPMNNVREFRKVQDVTVVPGCPEHILGLMNVRGELLALVDIRPVLHLQPADAGAPQQSVIVQTGELRFGITVDAVIDVVTIPDFAVHGVGIAAPSRLNGFVQGTVRQGDTLLSILDLDRTLQEGGLIVDESAAHTLS